MATLYTTKQGQTVDLVCKDHYGRTADVTEMVLAANPGLAALGLILPIATVLTLPNAPALADGPKLTSLWE